MVLNTYYHLFNIKTPRKPLIKHIIYYINIKTYEYIVISIKLFKNLYLEYINMSKKTNQNIIIEMINSRDDLTEQSKKQYRATANALGFSILYSEKTIIDKLKNGAWENPNTIASHLNIIILSRNHLKEPTEKLVKYRNSLKKDITELRKKKMTESKKDLPSYETLIEETQKRSGLTYIFNYNIMKFGLRNKDQNLRFYTSEPDNKKENYIIMSSPKTKKVMLIINDYKTDKKYKQKKLPITDSKFIKELSKLNLSSGDYIMAKRNGEKMQDATFNERIKGLTINQIGEADMFKILVSHLLKLNQYKTIEDLVFSRGVSMTTMMKSYNLHNNSTNNDEQPKTEGEFNDAKSDSD